MPTKDAKCTIDYGPIVVDSKGKLVGMRRQGKDTPAPEE